MSKTDYPPTLIMLNNINFKYQTATIKRPV